MPFQDKSLQNLQTSIKMLRAQLQTHQQELGTELTQNLTAHEQQKLDELNKLVEELKEKLIELSTARSKVNLTYLAKAPRTL